jgi:hypothetical protein
MFLKSWLLRSQLKSKNPKVRLKAVRQLGAEKDQRAFEQLGALVASNKSVYSDKSDWDNDCELWDAAASSLVSIGESRAESLLAARRSRNEFVRSVLLHRFVPERRNEAWVSLKEWLILQHQLRAFWESGADGQIRLYWQYERLQEEDREIARLMCELGSVTPAVECLCRLQILRSHIHQSENWKNRGSSGGGYYGPTPTPTDRQKEELSNSIAADVNVLAEQCETVEAVRELVTELAFLLRWYRSDGAPGEGGGWFGLSRLLHALTIILCRMVKKGPTQGDQWVIAKDTLDTLQSNSTLANCGLLKHHADHISKGARNEPAELEPIVWLGRL